MSDDKRADRGDDLLAQVDALRGPEALSRHLAPAGECKECDRYRAEGVSFHPSHTASPNCQSGRRAHCTCDTCF